jgi:hypothetical protein
MVERGQREQIGLTCPKDGKREIAEAGSLVQARNFKANHRDSENLQTTEYANCLILELEENLLSTEK